jgi:type I restriction enzyme R subunit
MSSKEASARIKINKLLEESGWRFQDDSNGGANIQLEAGVSIHEVGDDYQNTRNGFIDYLLLDDKNFPLCVLEAKKESIHPLSAKEQARDYAIGHNVRFVILSNGNSHYLWDTEFGNPEMITEFPSQESLIHRSDYKPHPETLFGEVVDESYLAPKKKLRNYQVDAIRAVQGSAKQGKTRFLLEMATGTGKTTTAGAICKLFLRTGNASRILFLVDRIELEQQAVDAFKDLFEGQYFIEKFKDGKWQGARIVVSTIQTLLAGNKYREYFSPSDFELVISDEAHRSIGGNSRAVFEYFLGYKLGLTATPKDYLKGVDQKDLATKNIKALESRNLRSTYVTFGCEDGNPTFRYDLKKGVADNVLIQPYVIDARTEVTTELLSEEGYAVEVDKEDGGTDEAIFGARHFERSFFNEDTNRVFAETIIKNGLLDPLTGEFGKSLVFCVSRNHASKITNLLNIIASEKWGDKYKSDFAVQVTSDVYEAQSYTKDFTANRLLGKSSFANNTYPDYTTSKARVCVTVGMMTTGYDCPDLLNIALLRPVFSPSDFIQMKGRGTRKNTFIYQETGENKDKEKFLLIDFFGNCEYFEKDFDYDKKLDLPISKTGKQIERPEVDIVVDTTSVDGNIDANVNDAIHTETVIHVGKEGMRIDRDLYPHQQFEKVVRESETLQSVYKEQGVEGLEEYVKAEVFNKPSEYWNAEKIRRSYEKEFKLFRKISLTEMLMKALGLQKSFKSREERIAEEYEKFVDIEKPQVDLTIPEKAELLKDFFETYVSDNQFREIIDDGRYAELAIYPSFTVDDIRLLNGSVDDVKSYSQEYLQNEMAEFAWK